MSEIVDCGMLSRGALDLYSAACAAVRPSRLVAQALRASPVAGGTALSWTGRSAGSCGSLVLPSAGRVCVAAFGKASLGMCRGALDALGAAHVRPHAAIVACPTGAVGDLRNARLLSELPDFDDGALQLHEAAAHNMPDAAAALAARHIARMADGLGENDVLLALVSGGGSALLPAPPAGVTLADKCDCVKALAAAGANITQLNTVRQHLSTLKGGRLADIAAPAQVIALIFSDMLDNELDFVASGPTVPCKSTAADAMSILEKFGLSSSVAESIVNHLRAERDRGGSAVGALNPRVHNVLIGDISMALEAGARSLPSDCATTVVRHNVTGEAAALGRCYAQLLLYVTGESTLDALPADVAAMLLPPGVDPAALRAAGGEGGRRRRCLLFGGEPTVAVQRGGGASTGKGGRSQELALAFLLHVAQWRRASLPPFALLAAGTDGQDGPCDAAGAIVADEHVRPLADCAHTMHLAGACLDKHDSHTFWTRFHGGACHLKPGLTGTNVCDVHALLW